MARYIGPKCKLMRREGTDLYLKSRVRSVDSKCNMEKVPVSRATVVAACPTTACSCAKSRKSAVSTVCSSASSATTTRKRTATKGPTGEILLKLLESRLDNVVYRMGFGSTRSEARQLVSHKSITVNGKVVNVASYKVRPEDVVAVNEKAKKQDRIKNSLGLAEQYGLPEWVEVDSKGMSGIFKRVPDRVELPAEINEQLIVELYSK